MAEDDPLDWEIEPSESYLDFHLLYRGIHKIFWIKWPNLDNIQPNFFMTKNVIKGLSVDWSKYATPEFTLSHLPDPEISINGIIELKVGKLKNCIEENNFHITINHVPIRNPKNNEILNRAHTLLKGIHEGNKAKIKLKISKIAKWAPNMKPQN